MCGIAGWVSYDGEVKARWDVIVKMTETMALRGPDAKGIFIDRHVGLGHRRLAVIDLAGGVQPMQAEEGGRVVASLVYTGEAYNFVELRDTLKHLAAHCHGDDRPDCPIIERLADPDPVAQGAEA